MTDGQRLNNEIRFSRWWLNELMGDPKLNGEQILWMNWMLHKLETELIRWELQGFDSGVNNNSFLDHQICTN